MSVDSCNALVCSWLQQLAGDELLNCEHDSVLASNSNGGVTVLDCLHGILDLKVASIWREHRVLKIVTRTYRRLGLQVSLKFLGSRGAALTVKAYHGGWLVCEFTEKLVMW